MSEFKYEVCRHMRSWPVISQVLNDLVENNDLVEQTKRKYIVGAICLALAQNDIEPAGDYWDDRWDKIPYECHDCALPLEEGEQVRCEGCEVNLCETCHSHFHREEKSS